MMQFYSLLWSKVIREGRGKEREGCVMAVGGGHSWRRVKVNAIKVFYNFLVLDCLVTAQFVVIMIVLFETYNDEQTRRLDSVLTFTAVPE